MTDLEFATEVVRRLNALCQDPKAKATLEQLLLSRIVAPSILNHPTIQCGPDGSVGFLGMLNGLTGAIPDGSMRGWGYIMARVISHSNEIEHFQLTLEL